ncbi:unnamed protein product [Parnassius apollo]|uniref:(apollo) hypothetical protein n=1 Tax=Parnassius apollo TaxID=110799 RepID=A0A8S3WSZ6_PARAO|nr:unnamed protein product [Parnassius apollo]
MDHKEHTKVLAHRVHKGDTPCKKFEDLDQKGRHRGNATVPVPYRTSGATVCIGKQGEPCISPPSICVPQLVPPCVRPARLYTPPCIPLSLSPCLPWPEPCPPCSDPCPPCPEPCPPCPELCTPCPEPCPSCPEPCPPFTEPCFKPCYSPSSCY